MLDQRKTEPGAALGTTFNHINAIETLGQPRQVLGRDPWAKITHHDPDLGHPFAGRGRGQGDDHLAAGGAVFQRVLDQVLEQAEQFLAVAGDRDVPVTGDRDLLFDALSNLVDNAITHGREGTKVVVEAVQSDDGPVLTVGDDGPGIPPHEFQNVMKRFYRLERSRSTPGNGLGLSLVAAIARLHGASLEMIDNAPGLKVRMAFRRAQKPAAA
jgi:signal transduction histidine kinase